MSNSTLSTKDVSHKLEQYCAYQERCHKEVRDKLWTFPLSEEEHNEIVVHLIENNYLNEERFAKLFSVSKFNQKKWGKIRITNELKKKRITDYLINNALNEISDDAYQATFDLVADLQWTKIIEKNVFKKRKRFCDFLLRKGYESELIYKKVRLLEK